MGWISALLRLPLGWIVLSTLACSAWPVGSGAVRDAQIKFAQTEGTQTLRRGLINCGAPIGEGDTVQLLAQTREPAGAWAFTDADAVVPPTPICAALRDASFERCACTGAICLTVDDRPVCRPERYLSMLEESLWQNAAVIEEMWQPGRTPENAIRLRWPSLNVLIVEHGLRTPISKTGWSVMDTRGVVHRCTGQAPAVDLPIDFSDPKRAQVQVTLEAVGEGCAWSTGTLRVGPDLLERARTIRLHGEVPVARRWRVASSPVWMVHVQADRPGAPPGR